MTIREYRTVDALLEAVATDDLELTHTTLLHIKAFRGGVFSYAKRVGAFDGKNPVRDTVVLKGGSER